MGKKKHRMREEEQRDGNGNRKMRGAFEQRDSNMERGRGRPERDTSEPRERDTERQIIIKEKLRQKQIEREQQSKTNEAFEERKRMIAEDREKRERAALEQRKRDAKRIEQRKREEKRKHDEEVRKKMQQKTKKITRRRRSRFDLPLRPHPKLMTLCRENYAFQPCRTLRNVVVNIILVRAPMHNRETKLYEQYKDEILFIGISSFEDFPLPPANPFSGKFPADTYVGKFPGFLHMMHPEQAKEVFSPHVKLLLMSQSDFSLPWPTLQSPEKIYDFTLSGSDQDVERDCVGWSSFAKNWSFVKESLEVMCGEYNMTGVLVATKNKQGTKACTIPKSCKGKMLQTTFLPQHKYFDYLQRSHFAYLPQIHDASPRVSTQALALDVPVLMNENIAGGWKYVNDKTGEFFHDMSNFRESLERIRRNAKIPGHYTPRKWVTKRYGDKQSGARLMNWIVENFSDRVRLPPGTKGLVPSGA